MKVVCIDCWDNIIKDGEFEMNIEFGILVSIIVMIIDVVNEFDVFGWILVDM